MPFRPLEQNWPRIIHVTETSLGARGSVTTRCWMPWAGSLRWAALIWICGVRTPDCSVYPSLNTTCANHVLFLWPTLWEDNAREKERIYFGHSILEIFGVCHLGLLPPCPSKAIWDIMVGVGRVDVSHIYRKEGRRKERREMREGTYIFKTCFLFFFLFF